MRHHPEPTTDVVGLTVPRVSATLRASNDDRKRVTDWLQAQFVAGRLTAPELEERIEQALAARTVGNLDALTADLPPIQTPTAPWSAPESPRGRQHRHHASDK